MNDEIKKYHDCLCKENLEWLDPHIQTCAVRDKYELRNRL